MFTTLIESGATRERRVGGTAASVAVHTLLIVAAMVATATGAALPARDEPVDGLVYVPVTPTLPATSRSGPQLASATTLPMPAALPSLPRVDVAITATVPTSLPGVDVPLSTIGGGMSRATGVLGAGDGEGDGGALAPGGVLTADRVEHVARALRGNPSPRYPDALARVGIAGRVIVRFVIDTAGRVELPSVEIVASSDPAFTDAVRAVLPRHRFSPARVGERAVRMLAELPFDFSVAPR